MGYYINPKDEKVTKEQWLEENGVPLTILEAKEFDFESDALPVCLVDNGLFTAAGIAYDARERDYFYSPRDRRPKQWFSVKKDLLKEWYSEKPKSKLK